MKSNLAGLYIQIEAKKRRIKIITVEIVPKRAEGLCGAAAPPAKPDYARRDEHPERKTHDWFSMPALRGRGRPRHMDYRCSKSTGAVTSCTLKYLASAGYFRATASYIAYATLR